MNGRVREYRRSMRRRLPLVLILVLTLLAAGCGGSKKKATSAPLPTVARAKTPGVWVTRLVDRFLRDVNQDLTVVNALRTPQILLYIRTGNQTTTTTAVDRMKDLSKCSRKLARVGPPPTGNPQADSAYADFRKACPFYEGLAADVLRGIPLLSSRDPAVSAKGQKAFDAAVAPSRSAARYYGQGVATLQRGRLLRFYGAP